MQQPIGQVKTLEPAPRFPQRRRRGLLDLLLAAAIAGNLVRWDTYRNSMLQSHWFPRTYIRSGIIKGSLRRILG